MRDHVWRKALVAVGVPAMVYLIWYIFVAGPNPTAVYRAKKGRELLKGVPEFVGTMFVGAYGSEPRSPDRHHRHHCDRRVGCCRAQAARSA